MSFLEGLNKEQKEAVKYTGGPLLILAGAGSGKTRVVTHKIAYLIEEKGVFPGNILAITFTNKAAQEMKERTSELLNMNVDSMWIGTFHSVCVRILRRDIDKIGYENGFTIYDRDDQITLIRECIKEIDVNKEMYNERMLLSRISKFKDKQINPKQYIKENFNDLRERTIGELYEMYQKKLKEYNALDFDDLLVKTVELLNSDKDIREYYQNRFKYVFVDEYQDTNNIQYELARILSDKYKEICVVGDPDQSIYSWRGANIKNIMDFEQDFAGSKTILLEQNYRSTQNILDVANKVIRENYNNEPKKLWSDIDYGEEIEYYEFNNHEEEGQFVIDKIEELINTGKYLASDIAVLYRTNAQSRVFEDRLMRNRIPYRVVGGLRFYDRKEVKDIIAYLQILQNPVDNISMKRIINTPRRGIGLATIEKLEYYSVMKGQSLYETLLELDEVGLATRAYNNVKKFTDMLNLLIAKKELTGIKSIIEEVIEDSGYKKALEDEDTIESRTRLDNIGEFLSSAEEYEKLNQGNSLEDFLANVSLLSDVDKTEDNNDMITLMTAHSAKGLEFPVVFLVGMEEGLFPSRMSMDDEEDIEEERRLCYVAVTRAEELLYISSAQTRVQYGRSIYALPSRFIKEMDDTIKHKNQERKIKRIKSKRNTFDIEKVKPKKIKDKVRNTIEDIKVGDKIEHSSWGEGMIVQVKGEGNDTEVVVAFDSKGLKTLKLAISPIKLI